jgi:hypothetical protein
MTKALTFTGFTIGLCCAAYFLLSSEQQEPTHVAKVGQMTFSQLLLVSSFFCIVFNAVLRFAPTKLCYLDPGRFVLAEKLDGSYTNCTDAFLSTGEASKVKHALGVYTLSDWPTSYKFPASKEYLSSSSCDSDKHSLLQRTPRGVGMFELNLRMTPSTVAPVSPMSFSDIKIVVPGRAGRAFVSSTTVAMSCAMALVGLLAVAGLLVVIKMETTENNELADMGDAELLAPLV